MNGVIRNVVIALALLALISGCDPTVTNQAKHGTATYWSIGQPSEVVVTIEGVQTGGTSRYDSNPEQVYETTGPATRGVKLPMAVSDLHDEQSGSVIECRIEAFGTVAESSGRSGECFVELTP